MVATAERIDFTSHSVAFDPGSLGPIPQPSESTLTVDFRVFRRGPAHVSGLIFTTNFWRTPQVALAMFRQFDGDFEVWQAVVSEQGSGFNQRVNFEYVIFCDDHRGEREIRIKAYPRGSGGSEMW